MVVAITMVRDEADIVGRTVRLMRDQVDHVIVADNGSTDGTSEILDEIAREGGITVLDDPEVGYYQSRKLTALAHDAARGMGADWVVPFDADEVWLPRTAPRISTLLGELSAEVLVCEAALFDHVATGTDPDGDPVVRIGWRRAQQAPLRKVAIRPIAGMTIQQGNHAALFDDVRHPPTVTNALEVRHFPYRNVEQMVRKARNGAAAYAATDLPENVGAHWRQYGRLSDEQIGDVFRQWFWSADPENDRTLTFDPCPT